MGTEFTFKYFPKHSNSRYAYRIVFDVSPRCIQHDLNTGIHFFPKTGRVFKKTYFLRTKINFYAHLPIRFKIPSIALHPYSQISKSSGYFFMISIIVSITFEQYDLLTEGGEVRDFINGFLSSLSLEINLLKKSITFTFKIFSHSNFLTIAKIPSITSELTIMSNSFALRVFKMSRKSSAVFPSMFSLLKIAPTVLMILLPYSKPLKSKRKEQCLCYNHHNSMK